MTNSRQDPFFPYIEAYRRNVPDWHQRDIDARRRRTIDEAQERDPQRLYLNLLKRSLTGLTQETLRTATMRFDDGKVELGTLPADRRDRREYGADWPVDAQTMIGMDRIENIQLCVESVLRDDIPGDMIETGVWRGGATIFMRGVLKAYDITNRFVWVADSFAGLPAPDPRFPADADDWFHHAEFLAVGLDQVKDNFARYGLLDDQVKFLKGYFSDTLPAVRDRTWSVVRLDGDQYRSTMDALDCLYKGLSVGGYIIVDDYGAVDACREAVEHFRESQHIEEPVTWIDWSGVYWRRTQ